MEDGGVTLADVLATLKTQSDEVQRALTAQGNDMQDSLASVRVEIVGSVERVFKQVKAHVEEECKRVKKEVLGEVFTKDEVKEEVQKVASDLKRYVEVAVAAAVTLPPSSQRGSDVEDEGDEELGSCCGSCKSPLPLEDKLPTPPHTPVNVLSPPPFLAGFCEVVLLDSQFHDTEIQGRDEAPPPGVRRDSVLGGV
ncbi:hypothetical protein E2C01_025376 [Portunus trituberculatus]|uniref:Uncharacterized protein n=1 Tax=Portunus trituberculatus TaxID=210409 RepID=A0A5B7EGA6_PORTR|nr:hypothetical protein [Portunus trituberculatus]